MSSPPLHREIQYFRPPMPEYQTEILDSEKRFTITIAGTKVGKTVSHIIWLFEQAVINPQYKHYWWVAPVYTQALIAMERMQTLLSYRNFFNVNNTKMWMQTPVGTKIWFKTADKPDNLYGEDVGAVVFDEFTRAKKKAWTAIYTTLTATKGKAKLIGNNTGLANWGYQLGQEVQNNMNNKQKEWKYFKITCWDAVRAGILDENIVLEAQKDLDPADFSQLYLAKAGQSKDRLIKNDPIQNIFHNDYIKRDANNRFASMDIALYGSDTFVIGIWLGWVVVDILVLESVESPEVEKAIMEKRKEHNIPYSNITFDSDGIGGFLRGKLENAKPFNNGSPAIIEDGEKQNYKNLKTQCYYLLAKKINNNEIWIDIPDLPEEIKIKIMEDLQAVRRDSMEDGKLTILPKKKVKELIGRSPDFSDMMAMRMYFEICDIELGSVSYFNENDLQNYQYPPLY